MSARAIFLRLIAFLLLIGLACAVWAVFFEPSRVWVSPVSITLKKWPAPRDGYRIALLSDIHGGSPHVGEEQLRRIVKRVNNMEPDLILLGGDYMIQGVLGGTPMASHIMAEILGELRAKDGVYGVLGNHDWWDDPARIEHEFSAAGITMLEDKHLRIGDGESAFWLVGFTDYYEGPHRVEHALHGIPADAAILALTHTPDIFPELPAYVALTFAGHTHGGQVYIPFIGRPVVPSKYGERYAMGLKQEGEKQMLVSAGIGTSILPIRFMTPPEINSITLSSPQ